MLNIKYICDRCGLESDIEMPRLMCEFGRPIGQIRSLPCITTGHLCPKCEAVWGDKFYNQILEFTRGGD
jgi:hypothetical protein